MALKNKTLAAALALFTGVFGGHRFYLHGFGDWIGWLFPIPTTLGLYGLERVFVLGQDDVLSWILLPLLGFSFAFCALLAILYGLMTPEKWNAKYNPQLFQQATFNQNDESIPNPGRSNWFTVGVVIIALLMGTTALMSSIALSFQRYFEYQIIEAQRLSQ